MAQDAFKLANLAQRLQLGMGAVAEGLQARKDSKQKKSSTQGTGSSDEPPPQYDESQVGVRSAYIGPGTLEFPVILPQRRPKERSRGFLRAYALTMGNVGIDQQMWLNFLDDFQESIKATGWIKTINLASLASHVVPEPFSLLVSIAVKEAIRVAEEIDMRQKTNKFLDKANADIFRPRGTFCMVMTWQPDTPDVHPTMDLNTATMVSKPPRDTSNSFSSRLKASSGTTVGDFKLPRVAPLVFPPEAETGFEFGGDGTSDGDANGGSVKDRFKKAKAFYDDYVDRREQATWAAENPDNLLATQSQTKFRTKYADPNHPASIDPLGSYLTNGASEQVHLDAKARTEAAQLQGRTAAADARERSRLAQEQAQKAVAEAKARADAALAQARQAQARAGVVLPPLPQTPAAPRPMAPGAVVPGAGRGMVTPVIPAVQLNPLSQALVDGSQRLVETQNRYIAAGTKALQDVMKRDVIYLMVVNLPADNEPWAGAESGPTASLAA